MMAVSIQRAWHILRAFKSDSSECPRRTGVGFAERSERTWDCTCSKVCVAFASDSGVIPDHLNTMSTYFIANRKKGKITL